MNRPKLIQSPINPGWLIPEGWEKILGFQIDYRLGQSVLHLWRVQWNQHVGIADGTDPHKHPHHQVLYYQKGEGRLVANGEEYTVSKGSIFFIPVGCEHHFISAHAEPALCLALDFSVAQGGFETLALGGLPSENEGAVLLSLLHTDKARPFHLRNMDQAQVEGCIGLIIRENERRELGFGPMIQAHLLRLISLFLRATQRARGFGEHFRHTAWRHAVIAQRAQTLIREKASMADDDTSLTRTAKACGTSPNQLNRILKRHTGLTYHQILLRHRLDHAAELLRSGRANCTEAAFAAGFNDSSYFSRAFRKVFGHSPSDLGREE